MEISTIGRPRNVGWVRAAALLYGDWGTSKAYVIGLALAAVGFAALPHLLAVCALTGLVGINYIWVCKKTNFLQVPPSSSKTFSTQFHRSKRLSFYPLLFFKSSSDLP